MQLPLKVQVHAFRKTPSGTEFLVLHHKKSSFWQAIMGTVESSDDSIVDCAYREVEAATRISKENIVRVIENVSWFEFRDGAGTILKEQILGFEVLDNLDIMLPDAYDEMMWCCYEDALALLSFESNRQGLQKLHSLLEE